MSQIDKVDIKLSCYIKPEHHDEVLNNKHCTQYFCDYHNINVLESNVKVHKKLRNKPAEKIEDKFINNSIIYSRNYDNVNDDPNCNFYIGRDLFRKHKHPKYFRNNNLYRSLDSLQYIKYFPRKQLLKSVVHIGQLKLLINEIEFLTEKIHISNYNNTHIVYAGAAPGMHISVLLDMFPGLNWHLVDPNKFCDSLVYKCKNMNNVELVNDYFTDKTAKHYFNTLKRKNKTILFISDIRCGPEATDIMEEDIDRDNIYQAKWHKIMKSDYALLKFRIPRLPKDKTIPKKYQDHKTTYERMLNKKHNKSETKQNTIILKKGENCNNYDNTELFHDKYNYLQGEVCVQCFAPKSSTETRLIVSKNAKRINYSLDDYEGRLFYHNSIGRAKHYNNRYKLRGVDSCYDCTRFTYSLHMYKQKFSKFKYTSQFAYKSVKDIFQSISDCLHLRYKFNPEITYNFQKTYPRDDVCNKYLNYRK